MANTEHLKILKQGVKAWNKWRRENADIEPDLSGADLRGANLGRMYIFETTFIEGANLRESNLRRANLTDAELVEADLSLANLRDARLIRANLKRANLSKAKLIDADLYAACMEGSLLRHADFTYCPLIKADLSRAILTGAFLYSTARDNWRIDGIKCEYVYWDEDGEQRSPKDRDLEPGEFERLYAALPTIEYIFQNGMSPIDPLIMNRVVQAIREKQPEFDLKIDSINARGLAPSVKFTVQNEEHKAPALAEVGKEYQVKQAQLEGKLDEINKHIRNLIDRPSTINIINAPQAKYLAIDGSTLNVEETSNYYAYELQKVIAEESEESESFAKVAKKMALEIVGEAIKDIAKGQVKEAAKEIIKLGKDLGPIIAKTAAYAFFKNICI
ncbi:MAG: pentapeptide repeat-containing protein [Planctomycetota bacterium]|jgi:hypothetical protein